jgi:hypothetical protein
MKKSTASESCRQAHIDRLYFSSYRRRPSSATAITLVSLYVAARASVLHTSMPTIFLLPSWIWLHFQLVYVVGILPRKRVALRNTQPFPSASSCRFVLLFVSHVYLGQRFVLTPFFFALRSMYRPAAISKEFERPDSTCAWIHSPISVVSTDVVRIAHQSQSQGLENLCVWVNSDDAPLELWSRA